MTDAMSGAELATKSDLALLEHRLEKKINGTQISIQRFILAAVLSAMGINAAVILGAMFGLAKLLGH